MHNESTERLERRIVELEERIAWYETERAALDDVVRELFDRVDALSRRLETVTAHGTPAHATTMEPE